MRHVVEVWLQNRLHYVRSESGIFGERMCFVEEVIESLVAKLKGVFK